MALSDDFQKASEEVKNLNQRPGNDDLLLLYAYYKQVTVGDVSGKRPGMIDFKGRAKFDSWSKIKGTSKDDAQQKYIEVVLRLKSADS